MTQEQFTDLVATTAAGLAPILLTTQGHVTPDRLAELARVAADLAQRISVEARSKYEAATGSI
jgi:hypothetical protein